MLEKIGLTFNRFGEVVVGYADIENYITLFLSQSGVQSAVATPNNSSMMGSMAEMVTPFHRGEKLRSENH